VIALDACSTFCAALSNAVGPQITEWIMIAGVAGLAWWKTRKVAAESKAGLAVAHARADAAHAEAQDAKLSLARIEGSLRPSSPVLSDAPTLPPLNRPSLPELEGGRSSSGTYQPVKWPDLPDVVTRQSQPDMTLADPQIPPPAPVPAARLKKE
jgi:hypothetical protein